jgi:hypothetical protein
MWGRQSWRQPPFQAARVPSERSRLEGRQRARLPAPQRPNQSIKNFLDDVLAAQTGRATTNQQANQTRLLRRSQRHLQSREFRYHRAGSRHPRLKIGELHAIDGGDGGAGRRRGRARKFGGQRRPICFKRRGARLQHVLFRGQRAGRVRGYAPYEYGSYPAYPAYPAPPAAAPYPPQGQLAPSPTQPGYQTQPQASNPNNQGQYFLIAFNDHSIHAATAYKVDRDQIHWIALDGKERKRRCRAWTSGLASSLIAIVRSIFRSPNRDRLGSSISSEGRDAIPWRDNPLRRAASESPLRWPRCDAARRYSRKPPSGTICLRRYSAEEDRSADRRCVR